MVHFWKPEACSQTMLPDRSILIGQKLVENAKIQKFKCDILSNFQTMWRRCDFRYGKRIGILKSPSPPRLVSLLLLTFSDLKSILHWIIRLKPWFYRLHPLHDMGKSREGHGTAAATLAIFPQHESHYHHRWCPLQFSIDHFFYQLLKDRRYVHMVSVSADFDNRGKPRFTVLVYGHRSWKFLQMPFRL